MRTRTRRSLIVSMLAAVGIIIGTGCSSPDDNANASATASSTSAGATPSSEAAEEPELTASVAPTPPLEATPATSSPTETKSQPDVESDVARKADLIPCEASLDLGVINTTVRGLSKVRLDEVIVNDTSKFVQYSETCRYTLSGSGNRVASVTSTLLTDAGKTFYRSTCAQGAMPNANVVVEAIPYQFYGNVDDGCTFVPKANAPSGTFPGFVLRYRAKMVTVYLSGFDTVANNGEAVIREVKLRS